MKRAQSLNYDLILSDAGLNYKADFAVIWLSEKLTKSHSGPGNLLLSCRVTLLIWLHVVLNTEAYSFAK